MKFTKLDQLIYRLTARRWNRLISVVLSRHTGTGADALSSRQLHILASEFDPTQDACFKRIAGGDLWKRSTLDGQEPPPMPDERKVQRCVRCDSPTGRCEDDAIILIDGDGPLCEECYDIEMVDELDRPCPPSEDENA